MGRLGSGLTGSHSGLRRRGERIALLLIWRSSQHNGLYKSYSAADSSWKLR